MDDHPSLSNTAGEAAPTREADPARAAAPASAFLDAVAAWGDSLEAYLAAIRAYMREVGGAGPRAIGTRWAAAERQLGDAEHLLARADPATMMGMTGMTGLTDLTDMTGPTVLTALMAAGDAAEGAGRALDSAAVAALDPSLQASALAGMSRTYSESLRGLGRSVLEAGLAAKARYREAGLAAGPAGAVAGRRLEPGAIGAAYAERGGAAYAERGGVATERGGVATELYVGALLCSAGRQSGADAVRLLEDAKDRALGLMPDTPAAAIADARTLSEYHVLQAMAFAPAPLGPARELKDGAPAVDLSLPQARLAVTYHLAPLIDRRLALAYGPLASTATGLNYRLIERLRTIYAEPRTIYAEPRTVAAALHGAPLSVTTDGKLVRDFAAPGEAWAPFAGARPRVEAYSAATAAGILAGIRGDRANGWSLELRERYEDAVRGEALPSGECGEDALLAALATEFERAYDAAPPETPRDFRDLVVPEEPGPGDYLCAAAARLGFGALDARLHALHMKPAAARVPHAVVVREARVTQAIQAVDAGRKLWLRVKQAYRPDDDGFALPAGQKKTALMAVFRRIASEAVRVAPVDCAPATLKGFALTAPRLV